MRRMPFFVLDSFTTQPLSGNPAGVVLDAQQLSPREMQQLAGEVSLETAFVLPGGGPVPGEDGATTALTLRFFTSATEIPLCGHATVAAMTALARAGRIAAEGTLYVDTPVGPLKIGVAPRGESVGVTLFQNPPLFGPPLRPTDVADVAIALGCVPDALAGADLPVQVVSTGTPFLFVAAPSREIVNAAPHSYAAIARESRAHGAHGIYLFTIEADENNEVSGVTTYGRNFAPAAGLDEDPVTGTASAALGCYLVQHGRLVPGEDGTARFTAQQGFAMGRGGRVEVAVQTTGAHIETVSITGSAVPIAEGVFTLP